MLENVMLTDSVETHKARLHKPVLSIVSCGSSALTLVHWWIKSRGRCMIDFGNFYSLIAKIIFHTGSKRCPRRLLTGSATAARVV